MNKKFKSFIKTHLRNDNFRNMFFKIMFRRKLSIDDLIYIANSLNIQYSKILGLYISGKQTYSYSYVVQLIENKEVNKLKEVILNNGIILRDGSVLINSCNSKEISLDDKYYQELLKILIEEEVELAKLISSSKCHLKDINPSIKNIEKYLFDEKTGDPVLFLNDVYSSIDYSIKDNLEPKLVKVYMDAINKINSKDLIEVSNTPFISIKNDGNKLIYVINDLYKQFKQENINLINSKLIKE